VAIYGDPSNPRDTGYLGALKAESARRAKSKIRPTDFWVLRRSLTSANPASTCHGRMLQSNWPTTVQPCCWIVPS